MFIVKERGRKMLKVLIANNMDTYLLGKSDGLTFKDVSSEDFETLKSIADKYGKQLKTIEVGTPKSFVKTKSVIVETVDTETPELNDKRKVKKIFITNGKETIKIVPEKLPEYLSLGYKPGRKLK